MENNIFNDNIMKSSRLVLCSKCDNEIRVKLTEEEVVCEECGEKIMMDEEFSDDFIWHPDRKF